MKSTMETEVSAYDDHRRAWEELASGIAQLKDQVEDVPDGQTRTHTKPGELIIIGSGIETVGFSIGDQQLLQSADKVLYCVADPATIVWLRRLRPDALDLYVLYGDDKIRYTTYMQMTEAQLYWVRKGLRVVVVFYGHPGIFVLSTHRALRIARREGHRATMKAGVSALDTLCADLSVDPSHPGLQTHEATDALTRRRKLDTSLHVILWQVGLIGELGYRRQGYLNSNFSYFVSWLQGIYGQSYPVTHYIGSRYPSVEPLIEVYPLSKLHEPEVQGRITGLSTFYLAPRDVVPTDAATVADLGLLREGDRLVTPSSPLRDIARYGTREKAAFRAFAKFRIPPSYRWQDDTTASDFLIALRLDPQLQRLYREAPQAALADPRFSHLTEQERGLLASRDSGSIQIAAKGAYKRSPENERFISELLCKRTLAASLARCVSEGSDLQQWLRDHAGKLETARFQQSVDWLYRNAAFPWTSVYVDEQARRSIVFIGHRVNRARSLLFIDGVRVRSFQFADGSIRWNRDRVTGSSGVIRLDHQLSGQRRLVGKVWTEEAGPGSALSFTAAEADPGRAVVSPYLAKFPGTQASPALSGSYALRSNGRFAREVMSLQINGQDVRLAGLPVEHSSLQHGCLSWTGGAKDWFEGKLNFVADPITGSVELFGKCRSRDEPNLFECYGAKLVPEASASVELPLPTWAVEHLVKIGRESLERGGLLLWHKWEKASFANRVLTVCLMPRI